MAACVSEPVFSASPLWCYVIWGVFFPEDGAFVLLRLDKRSRWAELHSLLCYCVRAHVCSGPIESVPSVKVSMGNMQRCDKCIDFKLTKRTCNMQAWAHVFWSWTNSQRTVVRARCVFNALADKSLSGQQGRGGGHRLRLRLLGRKSAIKRLINFAAL